MIVSSETINENLNKMRTVILTNPLDNINIDGSSVNHNNNNNNSNINNNENHSVKNENIIINNNNNLSLKRKYTTYVQNNHPINCHNGTTVNNNNGQHQAQHPQSQAQLQQPHQQQQSQQQQQQENDFNNMTSNDIYKTAKKTFDSYNYNDYHQNQQHYEILHDNSNFHNQTIEFVNVTFDNNLLPVQNPIISEHNSMTMNELPISWSNAELIDLDSRHTLNLDPNNAGGGNKIVDSKTFQENSASTINCNNGGNNSANNLQQHKDLPNIPDISEDIEDKNLSWLFNYKLDELPHLSPEVRRKSVGNRHNFESLVQETVTSNAGTPILTAANNNLNHLGGAEEDDLNVAENVVVENTTPRMPKKPPFTYTELIEYALEDKGELTVSGIYQWISDRFPFYKSNDDRWKNSVRHNLSINPHFRKGNKAPQGAGHLWTISSRDSEANFLAWEHKKQRLELFFKMEAANNAKLLQHQQQKLSDSPISYDETAAATASISSPNHNYDIEAISYDVKRQIKQPDPLQTNLYSGSQELHYENVQNDELKRSAGEILNGVRRNVEVQIMHPLQPNHFQAYAILDPADYLNPVPKEEVVQECGLRSSSLRSEIINDYYVTTIDPIELGINMSTNAEEEEILFEDDFNLNYFGNNIMT